MLPGWFVPISGVCVVYSVDVSAITVLPMETHSSPLSSVPCSVHNHTTAEQALIGYCKVIAEINRNKYVMRYRSEPRLTDNGAHDFKVRPPLGICVLAGLCGLLSVVRLLWWLLRL